MILHFNYDRVCYQAGSWPIGQSNLPTFAIPSEVEGSLKNVSSHIHLSLTVSYLIFFTYVIKFVKDNVNVFKFSV